MQFKINELGHAVDETGRGILMTSEEYINWIATGGIAQPYVATAINYRDRRAAEYPPMNDYIDGMVKQSSSDPAIVAEGNAQVAAYFAACLAVKSRIPKV